MQHLTTKIITQYVSREVSYVREVGQERQAISPNELYSWGEWEGARGEQIKASCEASKESQAVSKASEIEAIE